MSCLSLSHDSLSSLMKKSVAQPWVAPLSTWEDEVVLLQLKKGGVAKAKGEGEKEKE